MTQRLSQLLHDEAGGITNPPPPDPAALALQGRRLRRRRTATTVLASAAAVAVVAAGTAIAVQGLGDDRSPDVVTTPAEAVVYAVDDTVHLGGVSATVPGTAVTLDRTATGAVVTTSRPGVFLVRDDGTAPVDLGRAGSQWSVATDPDDDVFVQLVEGTVVVRDDATGDVVRELPVPDTRGSLPRQSGIDLDDGTAYVSLGPRGLLALDVETGEARRLDLVSRALPAVSGGLAALAQARTLQLVDVQSGEVVDSSPVGGVLVTSLSPDARWVLSVDVLLEQGAPVEDGPQLEVTLREVGTDRVVTLDREDAGDGWGWTLTGEAYRIDGDEVVLCEPATGECSRSPAPEPLPDDRIAVLPDLRVF